MVNMLSHGSGTNEGRFDATVADCFSRKGSKKCLPLIRRQAKFGHLFPVAGVETCCSCGCGCGGVGGNVRVGGAAWFMDN